MIKYRKGYKYQLAEDYKHQLRIFGFDIKTAFLILTPAGLLIIKVGYAWDGPSGPTWDSLNSMRASLVHDALYQLMRERHLPLSYRGYADKVLYDTCIEAGMWKVRAGVWHWAVSRFAGPAAMPENRHPVIVAP